MKIKVLYETLIPLTAHVFAAIKITRSFDMQKCCQVLDLKMIYSFGKLCVKLLFRDFLEFAK